MSFIAIPTLAGQAALAAAIDVENPVPVILSEMVVGDGNGNAVTPLETQVELVNQRAVVPVASVVRADNKLTIDAVLDETVGGWTIREAGILDENGVLLFVASIPATEKGTTAQNVEDILTLGLIVIVSDTAQVHLVSHGTTWATHEYVNLAIANRRSNIATPLRPYHIAVKSMAITVPPISPTPGDTYLVPADATGAFAGQTGRLAQYLGSEIWSFVVCPNGQCVGNEADGLFYQRIEGAWKALLPANKRGWLRNDGSGGKSWGEPFDIKALPTRAIEDNDLLPLHSVAEDERGKNTVAAFAEKIAPRVTATDYLHSEMFFYGMM